MTNTDDTNTQTHTLNLKRFKLLKQTIKRRLQNDN